MESIIEAMAHALSWSDFEIISELGSGHSGAVYRARLRRNAGGLQAGDGIAVKVYKEWALQEPGQIERILREIDTGRRIRHPNVLRVHAAVLDERGRPALVMHLYDGSNFDDYLIQRRQQGTIALDESFRWLRDIAAGLVALHDGGVIHRDVKPANLLATPEGLVLGDFGVVRSENFPEQTTTGAFLGTIRYAAPEYLFGDSYDERVDVYALGAIAYEVLTGFDLYDRSLHWAKLVAAKQSSAYRGLPLKAREDIVADYGWNTAACMNYIISHSCCEVSKRDLDLKAFVAAIDTEVWRHSFVCEDGRIARGEKVFSGRYRTAIDAADAARRRLSGSAYDLLLSLLETGYWRGRTSGFGVDADLRHELIRTEMIRKSWRGEPTLLLDDAVREAFALRLLQPREAPSSSA